MNDFKLKLYRNYPQLFGYQIKKILNQFEKNRNDFLKPPTLVKILPYMLTDEFFDYITNKCDFSFRVDELEPDFLKNDPKFAYLLSKYQPHNCFDLPDEMLEDPQVLINIENNIMNNSFYLPKAIFVVPRPLEKSDLLFHALLDYLKNDISLKEHPEKYNFPIIYFYFLNSYINSPEKIAEILNYYEESNITKKISDVLEDDIKSYQIERDYPELITNIMSNEMIAKYFIDKNLFFLKFINNPKIQKEAFTIIAEKIKNNNQEYFKYLSEYVDILSTSEEVIKAILHSRPNETNITILSGVNIETLSPELLESLVNYTTSIRRAYVKGYFASHKVLNIYLKNHKNLSYAKQIYMFKDSAFNYINLNYILEHYNEFSNYFKQKLEERINKKMKALNSTDNDVPYIYFYFASDEVEVIKELTMLITEISKKRVQIENTSDDYSRNITVNELKALKRRYDYLYKKLLSFRDNIDLYKIYEISQIIYLLLKDGSISTKNHWENGVINDFEHEIREFYFGYHWCALVDNNDELHMVRYNDATSKMDDVMRCLEGGRLAITDGENPPSNKSL